MHVIPLALLASVCRSVQVDCAAAAGEYEIRSIADRNQNIAHVHISRLCSVRA